MSSRRLRADSNVLLEHLRPQDRERFFDQSSEIQLGLGDTVVRAGEPMRQVLFPMNSFVSLTTTAQGAARSTLEVAMVGRESAVGVSAILGVDRAPHNAIVQGAGSARSLATDAFLLQVEASPHFRQLLQRALFVLLQQITATAACTHFHRIEQRLARWLLMSQDRSGTARFRVTQEFLSVMLGVQRVGVTRAAGDLQRRQLIHYQRGILTVLDRQGLEAASCACYDRDRSEHRVVMSNRYSPRG